MTINLGSRLRNGFTIGADPELFVKKHRVYVAATGLVEGDKQKPFAVDNGAVQVDGLALEFNIAPSSNFNDFNNNIVSVVGQLKNLVKQKDSSLSFSKEPWVDFPMDYYDSLSDEQKTLGCDPDFNAYTGEENPSPMDNVALRNRRGAAGHIHIGWGQGIPVDHPDHIEICRSFVRKLDRVLGLVMIAMEPDAVRKSVYGMAGAFRPKSYGVEYRVPSNVWVFNKTYRAIVFAAVKLAIEDEACGKSRLTEIKEDHLREMINTNDYEGAAFYLSSLLPKLYSTVSAWDISKALKVAGIYTKEELLMKAA